MATLFISSSFRAADGNLARTFTVSVPSNNQGPQQQVIISISGVKDANIVDAGMGGTAKGDSRFVGVSATCP